MHAGERLNRTFYIVWKWIDLLRFNMTAWGHVMLEWERQVFGVCWGVCVGGGLVGRGLKVGGYKIVLWSIDSLRFGIRAEGNGADMASSNTQSWNFTLSDSSIWNRCTCLANSYSLISFAIILTWYLPFKIPFDQNIFCEVLEKIKKQTTLHPFCSANDWK